MHDSRLKRYSLKMLYLGSVGSLMLLAGCEGNHPDAKDSKNTPPAAAMAPMAPPVTVISAVERTVQPKGEWSGRFEATESVEVRARVAGSIEHIHFSAGQRVKQGDLLFTLDTRPFELELERANAQLDAARAQLESVHTEKNRVKKLLEAKASSQQELDQLTMQQKTAEAALKTAQTTIKTAQLNLSYAHIRAPISGRISRTSATVGNLIGAGTPVLTTLVASDKIYVYFSMSEQAYLRSIEAFHNKNAIPVQMGVANELGTPHEGRLNFVDNQMNPATGTVQARAVFDNPDGRWIPGLFARISLAEGKPMQAILVPDRAIGTDQSKKVVWVVDEKNVAMPREVSLGAQIDHERIVTAGLKVGERVIIDGVQRVQPGMVVAPSVAANPVNSAANQQTSQH